MCRSELLVTFTKDFKCDDCVSSQIREKERKVVLFSLTVNKKKLERGPVSVLSWYLSLLRKGIETSVLVSTRKFDFEDCRRRRVPVNMTGSVGGERSKYRVVTV